MNRTFQSKRSTRPRAGPVRIRNQSASVPLRSLGSRASRSGFADQVVGEDGQEDGQARGTWPATR